MIANRKGNSGITQTIVDGSDTTTERLWAMTDANYNVVELIEITNGGWTINDLERYTYDAYGTPTVRDLYYNVRATGTAYDWQHLFTGQRQDLETGLYHYRNRQYHAALGTFVTRDPLEYEDGFNLFEYVQGNPIIRTDPKGLKFVGPICAACFGSYNKCIRKASAMYGVCLGATGASSLLETALCGGACSWALGGSPLAVAACILGCTSGISALNIWLTVPVCNAALFDHKMKCGNSYNRCSFNERGCGCGPGNENWRPD